MRKIVLYTALLLCSRYCPAQDTAKLNALLNAYASQYKFNGSALVVYKGKVILDKGYGFRHVADSARNTPASIFQIGSITKQFTTTVIMKLQEEKKLSTRDKLSKYFPAYPKGDSITLEHLMTHTSGIHSYTNDEAFMTNEVAKPHDRKAMMALFENKPLDFSPGTKWDYSNSGYMLLGYIIEDVTGMPYEQVVKKYIFQQAGMKKSGFDFTHLQDPNKATGYFRLTEMMSLPSPVVDSSVSYAAGAIYATSGDLYQWFKAMQANKIITGASKAVAQTPFMNGYGYGWMTDSMGGRKTIGHSGGIHGFNSNMVSVPDDNTTVILLANVSTSYLDHITRGIYAILYGLPYEVPAAKTAITLSPGELKEYEGTFDLAPYLVIHIKLDNEKLMATPEGQRVVQLHPEKKDLFFIKEVEAQLKFTRNEKGEIVELTLLQGGREVSGKKR